MNATQFKLISTGLLFLLIFLSGFGVSHSGRPYGAIVFAIHKLTGLAAFVLFIKTIYQINQVASLNRMEWIAGIVTGLFFALSIISGSLVSIDPSMPAAILKMHKLFPYLTLFSTAATLYLLLNRQS